MRAVLATFGTAGDVTPFIHVGRALAARGHTVELITDVAHRALAEQHRLPATTPIRRYDPVALTTNPGYTSPTFGPLRLWRDIFLPLVPELFHAVGKALEQPADVVFVHPWCFGALYAAEQKQVPAVSVSMAPITWWSAEDPGLYSHLRPPAFLHRAIMRWPVRWALNGLFGSGLTTARRALGLPRQRRPFFALGREVEASYALWPALFRGPIADDPRGATFCGFLHGAPGGALSPELEQFLSAGPAPIVLGVGSLLPAMAHDVYSLARAVIGKLGFRAVLVGAPPELAGPDTFVAAHVPYAQLFHRAKVVVHHGGAGTLAEALRCGRPQVVVPFGNDQYDNAWRVERLGLGLSAPRLTLTAQKLEAAIGFALQSETEAKAKAFAAQLNAQRDGAEVLVDDLERRLRRALP
jgi:UDP:flavonoid glycosyltransferase YjiC (YdhE family)